MDQLQFLFWEFLFDDVKGFHKAPQSFWITIELFSKYFKSL